MKIITRITTRIIAAVLLATPVLASADEYCDSVHTLAESLEESSASLHEEFVDELKERDAWRPCGDDKLLYTALCRFESAMARVHAAIDDEECRHTVMREMANARGWLMRALHSARHVRLCDCLRGDLSRAARSFSRLECALGHGHDH